MIDEIQQDAQQRMNKSIESLKKDLANVRTGRAHVSLLDQIQVDYYDNPTPLNQVASVSVGDARTLNVTPWEKTMVQAIEKAIMKSDLGLNPSSTGMVIRVPMPALTEERRKELIKVVRNDAEHGRIAIRNIRRDANNQFKELVKEKEISEDEERRASDAIQKLTDRFIGEVDTLLSVKEKDLLEV